MTAFFSINRIRIAIEAELARAARGKFVYVAFFFVAATVVLSGISGVNNEVTGDIEPNGYNLFASLFARGIFVANLCVLIFGALSISQEGGQGLFRMVLVRPFRRWEYFTAKVFTTCVFSLLSLWLVFFLSYLFAGVALGYGDVSDAELNYVYLHRAEIMPAIWLVLAAQAPIIIAAAGLATLASALTDNAGLAVGAALGAYLSGSVISILSPGVGSYCFTTYSGYLLSGNLDAAGNAIATLSRLSLGVTEIDVTREMVRHSWFVGLGSFAIFVLIAGVRFSRRDILR